MKLLLCTFFLIFSFYSYGKTLQVMSYNVENLFDARHDVEDGKQKNDWTFLPKDYPGKKQACLKEMSRRHQKECASSDWTEAKVELKLSQIHDVVLREHSLPDFLGVVEVENVNVASKLAKKLGFEKFEMTTSPDERGIDVALFYKANKEIKFISKKEHVVPVDYPTRNILEVEFLINNQYPLTIFVNHWPSLANPDSWRVKAAEILLNRAKEITKKNSHMNILAMGDFNTVDENNPHPFKSVLYKDDFFIDIENAFRADKIIDEKVKKIQALGTYYFSPKDQWNSLDHFFANQSLLNGKDFKLKLNSFEIYSPSFISHEIKKRVYEGDGLNIKIVAAPKRYNLKSTSTETAGYSDHFPILVKLEYPDTVLKVKQKTKSLKHKKKY